MMRMISAAFLLVVWPHLAVAAVKRLHLCPGSLHSVEKNPLLVRALNAVYPNVGESHLEEAVCLQPYEAIPYEKGIVLVTQVRRPDQLCHACPASLDATFLKSNGDSLVWVGHHRKFAETGEYGAAGLVRPVRLGSSYGLVIENRGSNRGYYYSYLEAFVIQNQKVRDVTPSNGIPLGDSDCGAGFEEGSCRDVQGSWRVEGNRLLVYYAGTRHDETTVDATAVYALKGNRLILISGEEIAADMIENRP